MPDEILSQTRLTESVTLMVPYPRFSNGEPFDGAQAELGDDVPEPFKTKASSCPFAAWQADGMAYGIGPTLVATAGDKVFYVSKLTHQLQGFLIGQQRPNGRINWLQYKRLEGQTFEQARATLVDWTAKTASLLPKVEAA